MPETTAKLDSQSADPSVINYRPDIDALRGLSVLLVVGYHAFPKWFPGGFIGVDIFFVISGYLITSIILQSFSAGNFSLNQFYARRIRRLFPALLLVLATTLIAGWLVMFPDEFEQTAGHVKYAAIYWLNFALIGELGYFDVNAIYKPLLHLWSLSVEEQYYVVWPFLLLLVLRQKWITPLSVIILISLFSLAANIYFISAYPDEVYFHTATRIWQLALGSALAILAFEKVQTSNICLLLIGTIMIIGAAWLITDKTQYPGWWALMPTLGALLILQARVQFKHWGGLVHIGLISYPLYLWHWVVLSFVTIYIGKTPEVEVKALAVIASFGLACLTWKTVERIRYRPGRHVPILLMGGTLVVGLVSLHISNQNGLPNRDHLDYLSEANLQFVRTQNLDVECEDYSNARLPSERVFYYCRAQALNSKKLIAVIGDSHAHAIYPGIAKQAEKYGYGSILFANSGCPPLIGFPWGRNDREVAECNTMIDQIIQLLQSEARIEKVFISTRGPVYVHGEVEGIFTEESVVASLSATVDSKKTYQAYFKGFENTLSILEEIPNISSIYYLLENPELDFQPKEIIPRPFDRWGISTRDSYVDFRLHRLRMENYSKGIHRVGELFKKLTIIEPALFLCDIEKCKSIENGQFLYADDDHFSVYGANYTVGKIENTLFTK